MSTADPIAIAEYRLLVAAMYAEARRAGPGPVARERWAASRDQLFRTHSQSPFEEPTLSPAVPYHPYDPAYRIIANVEPHSGESRRIAHSGSGSTEFVPFGRVSLHDLGIEERLTVYWLNSYGGGIFLPFRDGSSGTDTYGGGRYLLDTVKGAYLGRSEATLVLDFNYAYHPSCVYSDSWSCPLAPVENHLRSAVPVGERLAFASLPS